MVQGIATRAEGAPDLVITNVVVLDHWGIVKCDVGVRDGRIVALGKAGNPDVMDGVDPALAIGPTTEIIAGEGRILTAGAIDCHVHLITPPIVDEAVAAGITTLIGGGTGPAEGTRATTVHAGRRGRSARCSARSTRCPVNVLLLGKGNTVSRRGAARAGARPAPAASSCTRTGARRRPRSTPACASRERDRRAGGDAHRHAQRGRLPRVDARRDRRPRRSTPTTPRARAAATRRTSSRSPRTRTCCRRRRTRRARTRSTRSPSTWTC